MKTLKITALMLSAVMVLSLCSCSQDTGDDSGASTTSSAKEAKAVPDKVELKNYKFPEFLDDIKQPDVLSSPVYVSFAASDYMTEVTEQPFDKYECTAVISNSLYVYSEGKFKGLLDKTGKVLLEADTYTSIMPCSKGVLQLSRDKELNAPDDYYSFNVLGIISPSEPPDFKADNITVSENIVDEQTEDEDAENDNKVCDLIVGGDKTVGEGTVYCGWEKIEAVTAQSIGTSRPFNAFYKAEKNGELYYICFDRFYNYTIYNGAYGYVRLKVGDGYGECYILDHEDYTELERLVESFGSSGTVKSPGKDEGLDYIQLELGCGTDDMTVMTISSDGYCLTEHTASGEKTVNNKYFSVLDKESFVSLVKWVDKVLSTEYVR